MTMRTIAARFAAIGATLVAVAATVPLTGCTRPGEQRALGEAQVGHAALAGLTVDVTDGLGVVRELAPGRLTIWASAPIVELTLTATDAGPTRWQLTIENALPDAALTSPTLTLETPAPRPRPTVLVQDVELVAGRHTLALAPPDVSPGSFRFAAVADIQTGLPTVDEVFRAIATTSPRFVVAMGDLTDRGELAEYDLLATQLATLPVPFYPTLGNHELWADDARYRERYGRSSYQFTFRGVAFTFVDSGDAGLDPLVEDELDGWLATAADKVHVFLTHIPPIDPIGVRYGSFRSRRDGQRLLDKLAAAGVDLTLYGHIHTYLAFENAGIPAFISGGGGARPERWDGIGRHFLVVDIAPTGKPTVGVHRVD